MGTCRRADATGGISVDGEVIGGINYDSGRFSPIEGKSLDTEPSPKLTMSGSAGGSATITPKLQAFLYGIGGPQLSLTTGLQLDANPSLNPWWTLVAPLEVDASLAAPKLGLDDGPNFRYTDPRRSRSTTPAVHSVDRSGP
jgi:hypothetical protein